MGNNINWLDEVCKRKINIIQDTQQFLRIKSVLDEKSVSKNAPLGQGIAQALEFLLQKGEKDGFLTKNIDGFAGHIEYGKGEELIGILCHVDVVPEGDGWTSPPFHAEIRDGKIFARGAIDDKGPTIAAYYALKIVKELGLPIKKRVRIIIGTDEESDWRCVDHYFKKEEMPTFGFVPDADFPIIHAEKGIFDFSLQQHIEKENCPNTITLETLKAGRRLNMVPDFAQASLSITEHGDAKNVTQAFASFLKNNDIEGKVTVEGKTVNLQVKGISAHAMEPNNGKNAGLLLIQFLQDYIISELDSRSADFVIFVNKYFSNDTRGRALGVAAQDDISGELTINVGTLSYDSKNGGTIGINLRYPVTHQIENTKMKIHTMAKQNHFIFTERSDSKPHYVDEKHPLITILKQVYEAQTGEKAELISIGGGTYARSLDAGVAFGPLFPGREDVAHQKDEYIAIEDLLKATAIYAQAIYELAKSF